MKMNFVPIALLLVLAWPGLPHAASGADEPDDGDFGKVTLVLSKSDYAAGEPILFRATYRNTTSRRLDATSCPNVFDRFNLRAFDEKDRAVATTRARVYFWLQDVDGRKMVSIQPGSKVSGKGYATLLFDLTVPGTYRIECSMGLCDYTTPTFRSRVVRSPPVTFKVAGFLEPGKLDDDLSIADPRRDGGRLPQHRPTTVLGPRATGPRRSLASRLDSGPTAREA